MPFGLYQNNSEQWVALVKRITSGDARGVEQFYSLLSDAVRGSLAHAVGSASAEDALHEVLVIVLEAILSGGLRDPRRLIGFVRTVAQRQAIAHIRSAAAARRRFVAMDISQAHASRSDSPDNRIALDERLRRVENVLSKLTGRDREILERFYLREQTREQICGEMRLTETQFRLFKSRAIARCSMIARINPPGRSELRSV